MLWDTGIIIIILFLFIFFTLFSLSCSFSSVDIENQWSANVKNYNFFAEI